MEFGDFYTEALAPDTINEALRLCDAYLGQGIHSRANLERIICNPLHHFDFIRYSARAAAGPHALAEAGALVGICYCYAGTAREVADGLHIPRETILEVAPPTPADSAGRPETLYGACRSVALLERFRGTGLARVLLDAYTDVMFGKDGVAAAFCVAWIRGNAIPAHAQLSSCGFERICIIEHPWSQVEDLTCPECHHQPCICDGILYAKTRDAYLAGLASEAGN